MIPSRTPPTNPTTPPSTPSAGMLPPAKPLVWVNTYREQYLDDTVLFNTVLAERMSARGNAVVADWFIVASAPDQTVLRSDNLWQGYPHFHRT